MRLEIPKIEYTENLDQFIYIKGNRFIDPLHVKKITESLKQNNLLHISPIVVNEKKEIIDGQHRLEAAKELDLGIYFITEKGLDFEDIQLINSNVATWSITDYIDSWAQRGVEDYIRVNKFMDESILSAPNIIRIIRSREKNEYHLIKKGQLIFRGKEERKVTEVENIIKDISPYTQFSGIPYSFIDAVKRLIRSTVYDHSVMTEKLELANWPIKLGLDSNDYLRQFEAIYNYKNKSNRVRLF